ncbi:ABC transporter ATP-binding protein [Candidatus Microgenomates bacterium]|nr:MAG: ABC transporter ATP-binding protein [Candidatus Microgenomates bacterium]
MQTNVLEVKGLTKKFDSPTGEFTAVDNVSFEITEGEILGLLGPNGAGKTTTIQMLLGVMEQTKGDVLYFNKPFKKHRVEILKQVNFSSTYISLPWQFTVEEILSVFARLYEVPDRKKRIKKLLTEFEMDELVKKQFRMLSAGEKTRLLLAKAFINYPKLILLDEPTASLDPETAIKIREFLKRERKEYNVSMLFTSHNMSEVEEMCDRVIILRNGKIVAKDKTENLAKTISDCKITLLIIDNNKAQTFLNSKKLPYEIDGKYFKITIDEKSVADFLMLIAKEKIEYREISIDKPDLEDYFLQIAGGKR